MTDAAERADLADAYALAIGISLYRHRPLPDVQDAPDVAAALTKPVARALPSGQRPHPSGRRGTRAANLAELVKPDNGRLHRRAVLLQPRRTDRGARD